MTNAVFQITEIPTVKHGRWTSKYSKFDTVIEQFKSLESGKAIRIGLDENPDSTLKGIRSYLYTHLKESFPKVIRTYCSNTEGALYVWKKADGKKK